MNRGFSAVKEKLSGSQDDPGKILTTAGSTLISTVGGASGPLYGTAFRNAGKALAEGPTVPSEELAKALEAGLEGIRKLGAAAPGDKTIVDALTPALGALQESLAAGNSVAEASRLARAAADAGAKSTVEMQARKGRASYLGPRSVGHQDPGATSTALIFLALERVAGRLEA
jgi:dihydroxyacetone kinase-like protein